MTARRIFSILIAALAALAGLLWWVSGWMEKRPLEPSGGLYVPGKILLPGPHFLQGDPAWREDPLGPTADTLGSAGCAVASAAMVLSARGADTDPGRLNKFLSELPGGYTPQGWLYWEKAAEVDPSLTSGLLPHYEDAPSFFLIDANILRGNPVIIRLRYPTGTTHFMVICGKSGFDYLVRDPGSSGLRGVYPLREFGGPIEALRFYRAPGQAGGR